MKQGWFEGTARIFSIEGPNKLAAIIGLKMGVAQVDAAALEVIQQEMGKDGRVAGGVFMGKTDETGFSSQIPGRE